MKKLWNNERFQGFFFLFVIVSIISASIGLSLVYGANAKTTTSYGAALLTRPMNVEEWKVEHYDKWNKAVNDIDTAFAHLGGVYADSLYKAALKAQRGYADTLTSTGLIKGNVETCSTFTSYKTSTVDSLYSAKGITTNKGIICSLFIAKNTATMDSIYAADGITSAKGIKGTTAGFSSTATMDSIYAAKGITTNKGLTCSTATMLSVTNADSIRAAKGITSAAGIAGTTGNFSSTVLVDSLSITKGLYAANAFLGSYALAAEFSTENANKLLVKTREKTFTIVDDFDTTQANTTAQNLKIDSLIPAFARVLDVVMICTDSVQAVADSAEIDISFTVGNASAGNQFIASASCNIENEVLGLTTAGMAATAVSNALSDVWVGATPAANWNTIGFGSFRVLITFIDNGDH